MSNLPCMRPAVPELLRESSPEEDELLAALDELDATINELCDHAVSRLVATDANGRIDRQRLRDLLEENMRDGTYAIRTSIENRLAEITR